MKDTETRYWLWAVIMPVIIFAITFFGLRFALSGPTDGATGKTFVITFISSLGAVSTSSVLTLLSRKYEESSSRVAVASCVLYFGVCVWALFF